MDKVINILSKLRSDVDFSTAKGLVTDKILDSIAVTSLISLLEESFDIEIGMEYMTNENFDSAEAIWNMVQKLQDE